MNEALPDHDSGTPAGPVGAWVDHRTLVGQRRRARTEAKIIKAALHVFAEKGRDAAVIDDFIKAAGIARGTFYNYFKSTEELLQATSTWLTDDLVESIEKEIQRIEDPVIRHGIGLRLWMRKAEVDPSWCAFVADNWYHDGYAQLAPIRDIRAGIETGGFTCSSPEAGFDLAMGTMRQAMLRIVAREQVGCCYGDKIAEIILRGLGADPVKIDEALQRPLRDMRRPTKTIK